MQTVAYVQETGTHWVDWVYMVSLMVEDMGLA
jgi:hypothetical protein